MYGLLLEKYVYDYLAINRLHYFLMYRTGLNKITYELKGENDRYRVGWIDRQIVEEIDGQIFIYMKKWVVYLKVL